MNMKYLFKINFILFMHICLSKQNLFFYFKANVKIYEFLVIRGNSLVDSKAMPLIIHT